MRSVYRPSLGTSARVILSDRAALLAQEGVALRLSTLYRPRWESSTSRDAVYSLSLNANRELPAATATYCFPSTM